MMKLFNNDWEFAKQPLHTSFEEMQQKTSCFAPVGIPHDWLIYQAGNLYEDGTGWYRKKFDWSVLETELVILRFDGIYMDSKIFVNQKLAGEWKYGYSTFEVDITTYLKNGENEVWVSVDFQAPNSRWYSGGGIYRNIWLKTLPLTHILSDEIYVHTEKVCEDNWRIEIQALVESAGKECTLEYFLRQRFDGEYLLLNGAESICEQENKTLYTMAAMITNPAIWDVTNPAVYELKVVLKDNKGTLQEEVQTIGFRTIELLPQEGMFLNGRKVKLNGVCEHHDLGCLGAAFHKKAMKRKLILLKQMGVNAIRTSHNMPAPELMELADEMGILIVTEAFDMWETTKTPYDYGRFFTQWYKKDVESWVKRDRNHPSLLFWSIGNEIYDTHAGERGQYWCKVLKDLVEEFDFKANAKVTIGSNYMPWENAQKCADIIKIAGYNYGEKYYDDHHHAHPDWIIYGSETASVVQSRGIYHFPYQQSVLTDEDEQCSSLGNSSVSWGAKSAETCIVSEIQHPYSCGQFIWTGSDYIGEPTPYHTRNSYFGQIDTAGFPKDSYYIYQSGWTDYKTKPMIHIFPYWDFNEGQFIDIRVCSNAPIVELFLNGKSQGSQCLDHSQVSTFSAQWQLPYEPGEIRAVACDENGTILAEEMRHSFGNPSKIVLKCSELTLNADGEDLLFVEISMEDEAGNPVENANNVVNIKVEGAGYLVGTDNGDSTDADQYKDRIRRLFSGKLLAIFKSSVTPGNLTIMVTSPGLPAERLIVPVNSAEPREGISDLAYVAPEYFTSEVPEQIQVRKINLVSDEGLHLHLQNPTTIVKAYLEPENAADQEVIWAVVDDAGIPIDIAQLELCGNTAVITAKSDGQFRLRCMSRSGTDKIRIISSLEFMISGMGKAFTNPYEFVSAGRYDYSKGEIGNGNEHGVATARDGESQVGFRDIDFGTYGSNKITIPIFALTDDPYEIDIFEGMPAEGGELVGSFLYQKPKIWNVYQEATYILSKRLRGVTSICFVLKAKVHIKGFQFAKYNRAWQQLFAGDCDKIYGDSFSREDNSIREIGNNVTLVFENLDFDTDANSIQICGGTPLEKNTLLLKLSDELSEETQLLEFTSESAIQTFKLPSITGRKTVSFVFLPGSNFDFHWFKFLG